MVSRRLLRIKILKALYGHFKSGDKTINASEKELFQSIEKTYDLYHYIMQLLVEVADYAQSRIDIGKQKYLPSPEEKNPNTKFVDNIIIGQLRRNEQLNKRLHQNSLSWENNPELVKKLYMNMLSKPYYKVYMADSSRSFEQDQAFALEFFWNEIEDFEDLYQILEDQSIYWIDDVEFELGMIIKTIKKFKEDQPSYASLMPLYKDNADYEFTKRLFRKATVNHLEYRQIVDEYTSNWDVDRIAYMDILIMIEAIAEMIEFKEMPIKISMNEFIELSKLFSTPNSSTFVNGVLDKVVKSLTEKGIIVKEGLGLVEPEVQEEE
jgi:N utilization substance protein B